MKLLPLTLRICCLLLLSLVYGALNAAPYPPEIASWSEATKEAQREAGTKLIKEIKDAKEAGKKEFIVPKGHYRFAEDNGSNRPSFIQFVRMKDLTIDFQGSTLWFETESTGLVLYFTDNFTIKNVTLDWDPLPFTQGIVTAVNLDSSTIDVQIDPGYERVVPGMSPEKNEGSWRGILFDAETRVLKEGQRGFSLYMNDWSNRNSDGSYRIKYRGFSESPLTQSGIEVGDAIAMMKRMRRAIRIEGGTHTVLENVTLYSSPFVTIATNVTSGDHGPIFRGVKIVRRPGTDRLLASNADGINIANSIEGPIIEDCVIENIGDDFINIHGWLSRVIWQNNPTEVMVSPLNARGAINEPIEIEFLDRKTLQSLGRRIVTGHTIDWTIEEDKCLADLSHRFHSGAAAGLAYGKKTRLTQLTLDKPIELTGDTIISCEIYSGQNATIRGNVMVGSLARGIRMQAPGSVIENNTIMYTMGPAITLQGHASYWGEGPYVHSTMIRNNSIAHTDIAKIAKDRAAIRIVDGDYENQQIAYDITIEDNRIYHSPGSAITARGVRDLKIRNNDIKGYGAVKAIPDAEVGANHAIVLQNISGLEIENNRIVKPNDYAEGSLFELKVSR
jgi:hypothetical protein